MGKIIPFTLNRDRIENVLDYEVGKGKPPSPKKGQPQRSKLAATRAEAEAIRDMLFKQGMSMHRVRMITGRGSRMIAKIKDGTYLCKEDFD